MRLRSAALMTVGTTALLVPCLLQGATTPVTAAPPPRCKGEPATIVGTNGDDLLRGTHRRDVIVAKGGHDAISGRGGDDLICAGGGTDIVGGDDGDDRIFGGPGYDTLMGGLGRDRIFGQRDGRICRDGCHHVGDTMVGGGGNDFFHGGDFQGEDVIVYTASSVRIRVDAAAGTVRQGSTTDRLAAGVYQTVRGSRYADRMIGSAGRDSFDGGPGADLLIGNGGRDRLFGHNDDDTIEGRGGDDRIDGGEGTDTADGGAGTDRCVDAETVRRCESG